MANARKDQTEILWEIFARLIYNLDRPCGPVLRASGYKSRGPCSFPGATRFSEKSMGLERGPLNLVSKIQELFRRKSSGFSLESPEYCRKDPSR
jgi:hypothetical protein